MVLTDRGMRRDDCLRVPRQRPDKSDADGHDSTAHDVGAGARSSTSSNAVADTDTHADADADAGNHFHRTLHRTDNDPDDRERESHLHLEPGHHRHAENRDGKQRWHRVGTGLSAGHTN